MSGYALVAIVSLSATLGTQSVAAQAPGFYFGAALGHTNLESPTKYNFNKVSSRLQTFLGGYRWRQDFQAEGRVTQVGESRAQEPPHYPDAPLKVRLSARLFEVNGGWSPRALRVGGVQPVVSAGIVLANTTEGLESDTPEDVARHTEPGAVASIGLDALLHQRVALSGRVSYRSVGEPVKVPADGIGIRGASWEIGVRVTP